MSWNKATSRIKAAVYLQHTQPTASVKAALNALKLVVATRLLRYLPTQLSNGVRPMNSFEKFFNRTQLSCQLVIAQADLRRANEFGRRLRYCSDMGEEFNTLNRRQRALHATGEKIRLLNKQIRQLKAELQAATPTEATA